MPSRMWPAGIVVLPSVHSRMTASAEKAERSANTSVMVSAAEQIGAGMGEEALR